LPQYRDAEETDVYVLSGSEDLVPVLQRDGTRSRDETTAPGYLIHRYRPRIEGLFARIERWTEVATGEIHWRSISPDNVTTLYGTDNNSRIFDPADPSAIHPTRVFSWLICETYDDKGNAIVYEYAAENDDNVDRSQANERNRVRSANRYLKRIKYGNRVSRLVQPDLTLASWMFEVVLDYDEDHYQEVHLDPARPEAEQHRFVRASASGGRAWAVRPDPFSSHRAGFEVRTYRRCRRVLMFHHIPDLPTGERGYDGLVRSTELDYADLDYGEPVAIEDELVHQGSTRFASFIRAVSQSGYVRDDAHALVVRNGVQYATYRKKSVPPLEFEYSKATIQDQVIELDAASLANLPAGIDGSTDQWVDLDGEGVSGILTEQANAWFYKPSLGEGRFGPLQRVAARPSLASLRSGRQQLLDLAGDGQLDLVALASPAPGFYERANDEDWEPFRAFSQMPNVRWDDPNLRFVDLNGDGHADLLITEQDVLTWYPSLAEEGFGAAQTVSQPSDEEHGPRLVLADGTQSIYLADMCGDGLADLVRIRNGDVCYWPNLGYGRFGGRVTMDNAPWFVHAEQFDQRRVRLADIDGSGTSDIIYLARDGPHLYFNQSGNRLSEARRLTQFPPIDSVSSIMTADLLGNGTGCLIWSSPLPAEARRPLRYIDLMGGTKPHLLMRLVNNLGAETQIHYAPSTRTYLADKRDGRPWVTRLPFPVHVVERVVTRDRLSGNEFVTRYVYHHGYFDGLEREFRGFGMVERWDTEEIAALDRGGQPSAATNVEASNRLPPILTKTWFHTGVSVGRGHVSDFFAGLLDASDVGEYYREPGLNDAQARALLLDDTVLPDGLTVDEEREACRALKGTVLRQEVYARDGSDKEQHPYIVTAQNFTFRRLQPREGNRHGVFFAHGHESISYHYDREPSDPRVGHALTLEVDEYGNVLRSAAVGYGRRQPDEALSRVDQATQSQILVTYTENRVTNPIDAGDDHRTPLPCESRTHELTGLSLQAGRDRFSFGEVLEAGATAIALDYEADTTSGLVQKRLIEHGRTYYQRNDMAGLLPLGQLESLALPFESYKLALTPGLVVEVFGGRVSDAMLAGEGGYVHSEGDANWWVPSGRIFYSLDPDDTPPQELIQARRHFFLPHRYRDPFHRAGASTESLVTYDAFDLLVQETRDALGNRVTVGERNVDPTQPPVRLRQDYRVLQPAMIMDPNRNRSEVAFDVLGMVIGTAVMGKPEEVPVPGDRLAPAFRTDLTQSEMDQFFANPTGPMAAALVGDASTRIVYDLTAYWRAADPTTKSPAAAATLTRETHASEPASPDGLRIQVSVSYSDGFGREIQKKIVAEPGPVPTRNGAGAIIARPDGQPQMTPNAASPRWVGSGWTIFNNKGKPVRKYEPFYTDTHRFEFDVRIGVSPVLFYDPVERSVGSLNPNHTWEKVVVGPWRLETWDVNDTVLIDDPATDRSLGAFFSGLPDAEYLPTWHRQRQAGTLGAQEQDAARKAAVHAATPTVAHADALGRTFLLVAHNTFKYSDTPTSDPPVEEFHRTRTILDIEGHPRELIDALDRVIMRYDYDMLGNRVHQASMEAGERWTLNDVAGKPLYAWDSRGHRFRTEHDALRRPTDSFMREGTGPELVVARTIYGEACPNPEASNLRGKVVQLFDQAGTLTTDEYDFKGNQLRSKRQLAQSYKITLDWSGAVAPEAEIYTSRTRYDALSRPIQLIEPHSDQPGATVNVIQPIYNEASLLEQVHAWLDLTAEPAGRLDPATASLHAVTDIDYDAKGQRERIHYGNGASTFYDRDPLTFRVLHVLTRRKAVDYPADCPQPTSARRPGCELQNLHYTYDPTGNITHIRDDAQQTILFRNNRVKPSGDFTYDAGYRLIEATGREHLGQVGGSPKPQSHNDFPRAGVLHPGDGRAMGRYIERYVYDAVGNFIQMQHRGSDPANLGWTRAFAYNEPSQLEPDRESNRLTRTTVGGTAETHSTSGDGYDAHGNMLRMPHLQVIQWDFKDQLRVTQRQAVSPADTDGVQHQGERTWYVYDSAGQRVRKVTEHATGHVKDERVYLGGFEIYRRHGASPLVRETVHIMDNKQRIALVETRTLGNEPAVPRQLLRFQHGNHLGSASMELDDQARIISYEEYSPYGSTSYNAVRNQTETPKRYRYTGKERDEESGLYYYGFRYYAPWLARWCTTDPAALADGANLYVYAKASPLLLVDPNGLYSWGEFWGDVKAGVAGAARGIVEPALVVMDFGQMGAALVTHAITDDPDDLNVRFLSATGRRIAASDDPDREGLRAGLVLATAMPTGGGSVLVDNVATVFERDMDPDEARRFLVRGAVGQVAAVGMGVGISRATGSGWTGRGSSAGDQALVERIVNERATNGETSTGRGGPSGRTYGVGRTAQGRITPVRRSPAEGGDPHAEPQVLEDVGSLGGRTIAADQVTCPDCGARLGAAEGTPGFLQSRMTGSLRFITPRRAGSPTGSPKAATIRAARAVEQGRPGVDLRPTLEFVVPFAPPIVPFQPMPSTPQSGRSSPSSSSAGGNPVDIGTGAFVPINGWNVFIPDENLVPAPMLIGVQGRF